MVKNRVPFHRSKRKKRRRFWRIVGLIDWPNSWASQCKQVRCLCWSMKQDEVKCRRLSCKLGVRRCCCCMDLGLSFPEAWQAIMRSRGRHGIRPLWLSTNHNSPWTEKDLRDVCKTCSPFACQSRKSLAKKYSLECDTTWSRSWLQHVLDLAGYILVCTILKHKHGCGTPGQQNNMCRYV